MRIAMIGSRGLGAREGGVERVVETLSGALTSRGHDVLVYGRERCMGREPVLIGGRSILTGGFGGKHLETLTHTATACWDVLRRGVDVVHFHSPGPALCMPMVKAAGLPVVLTVHAPDWRREKWSAPAKAALWTGLAVGMKLADAVTAVSPELAIELQERFGRDVAVTANAVDAWRMADVDELRRWNLQPGEYVLHVGRIVPEKRLGLLLHVWRQAGLGVPLVIAGGVGDRAYAKRCRREAPANVRWLDSVESPVLDSLYANAMFVVQPSVLEGASLVLLEAATHSRCIVAADIPANRGVLDDAAVWVSPDSTVGLAEALLRCKADAALRREMGRRANEHVMGTFTVQQLAVTMERMYEAVRRERGCA
jgi:glycosyltransferase involved in cell wall biosynthesis